jgi:hypothetical protein
MYKQNKSVVLIVSVIISSYVFAGENLLKNGNFRRGTNNWIGSISIIEGKEKNMMELTPKSNFLKSRQKLVIDSGKTYRISGEFSVEGDVAQLLFGVIPIDKDGRFINSQNTSAVSESETTLSEACSKGQSTIKANDASKWKKDFKRSYIAFKIDETGALKDLPNFHLIKVNGIKKTDQCWEITLCSPNYWNFKAGTKIRQHLAGGTYLYCGGVVRKPKGKKNLTGTISGTGISPHETGKWRPGTAYAQIMVLALFSSKKNGKVLISDLKFEEIKSEKDNAGK